MSVKQVPTPKIADAMPKPRHRYSYAPYTKRDLGYLEQLLRYHKSVAVQLEEDINRLTEIES